MTQHRVVMDVAARALEIRSPTFGDLTLYLPSQETARSCGFFHDRATFEENSSGL
jgi:hypothetical protein